MATVSNAVKKVATPTSPTTPNTPGTALRSVKANSVAANDAEWGVAANDAEYSTRTSRAGIARNKLRINSTETGVSTGGGAQPLGGFGFWFTLGIMVIFDLVSVLINMLFIAGAAIIVTVLGAPVGAAIDVLAEMIEAFIAFNIGIITTVYFYTNHVNPFETKRFVTMSVSMLIKILPFLSVLPLATLQFLIGVKRENVKRRAMNASSSAIGKRLLGTAQKSL